MVIEGWADEVMGGWNGNVMVIVYQIVMDVVVVA